MVSTVLELRDAIKRAMLDTVSAQRVVDKACRTPNAAKVGKCIDVEYLHSHLGEMGVVAPRAVIDELFDQLDPDGDGVVDYQAFLKTICGRRARDFLQLMQRLVTSDSMRETKMRMAARRERLAKAAALEIKDPFELLRNKLVAEDSTNSFRTAFRKFKCRSASHLGDDTIDFRGFKKALLSLGLELSEAQFRRVFNTIDKDGGRTIDFQEFSNALSGDKVTKSGVRDWAKEVAEIRRKQKDAYEAAAAIIRSPSGLYITLRNMFVGTTNAHKAFRSFLRLSGSADSFLDIQEIKKSLKIKHIVCAPGVVENLFRHLDPDNDGQITFGEFTKAFIDLNLSQLIDLDLAPAESKFKITKKKPRAPAVAPAQAMHTLREAVRERGTMRGLQLAFHRHRCSWKSVDGSGGVDIRGFQDALKSKGMPLSAPVVKGVFVHLDPNNIGVVTYAQFRDAVQDVVARVPTAASGSGSGGSTTLPARLAARSSWTGNGGSKPVTARPLRRVSPHARGSTASRGRSTLPRTRPAGGKRALTWAMSDPAVSSEPLRGALGGGGNVDRLPKFRDVVKNSPSNNYSKRDPNVALAATSLLRARQYREQRRKANANIYRNSVSTIH